MVGLGGSAFGEGVAMFEAVHGSAPDIAGQDLATPVGVAVGGHFVCLRQSVIRTRPARIQDAMEGHLAERPATADIYCGWQQHQETGHAGVADCGHQGGLARADSHRRE